MWIFYGMSMAALLTLRYKEPKLPRPYKVNLLELIQLNLSMIFQCPIVIPIIVLIISIYLVIAPIVDNPQVCLRTYLFLLKCFFPPD